MAIVHPFAPMAFSGLARGKSRPMGLMAWSVNRFPTDPVGTTTVTFDGVVAGSALQIESQDGSAVLHNSTAPGGSFGVTLSVYAPGSPLNAWRIKVRKGTSAPTYQPYETLMTATVGSSSIYINQLPD